MINTIYVHLANMVNIYNLNYSDMSNYNKDFMGESILKCERKREQELSEVLNKI